MLYYKILGRNNPISRNNKGHIRFKQRFKAARMKDLSRLRKEPWYKMRRYKVHV